MKKPLIIYGAGGLGREILAMMKDSAEFQVIGFIDDTMPIGTKVHGVSVLGDFNYLQEAREMIAVILAFGDPLVKTQISKRLNNEKLFYPVIVHRSAILMDKVSIMLGKGTVVCANVVLTTDIDVGEHVLINLNSTIGHDTKIGSCASIMTGVNIGGGVTVGKSTLIGSGANVKNRIRIGASSVVGMGSVVTRDVDDGIVVTGVPARILEK